MIVLPALYWLYGERLVTSHPTTETLVMSHPGHSQQPLPRVAGSVATLTIAMLLGAVAVAAAHDMFAKPDKFFVAANEEVLVRVLNGTFIKSENSIGRPRVRDITVLSPSGVKTLDTTAWSAAGDTSTFRIRTSGEGTYVLGAATRPNIIAMSGDTFNLYLKEDGIPDVLAARRRDHELDRRVRERYSKYVKAMIQAGNARTANFATPIGYAAEIIPLENPYSLSRGGTLSARMLVDGKPVRNQYVLYGGLTLNGSGIAQRSARSDSAGVVRIPLSSAGTWYVKFIHMARLSTDREADYESKWATLTFQVR
ncbi:MAG: DUF4198 domain-containing protein [Gemmatimonadaceae bacterium]